jgi:hypothetical protein
MQRIIKPPRHKETKLYTLKFEKFRFGTDILWIPAFAGMTRSMLIRAIVIRAVVIPAKAGIQENVQHEPR